MKIRGIDKINCFSDIIEIMDYCFSIVQWSDTPSDDKWLVNPFSWQLKNFEMIHENFKNGKYTGWCGASTQLMSLILRVFSLNTKGYNFGIKSKNITHVMLNVELYDSMWFLIDPYFNRFYTYKGEFPLLFNDLLRIVRNNDFDLIVSKYGKSSKIINRNNKKIKISPQDFEISVIEGFGQGFSQKLKDYFNDRNFLVLLPLKI